MIFLFEFCDICVCTASKLVKNMLRNVVSITEHLWGKKKIQSVSIMCNSVIQYLASVFVSTSMQVLVLYSALLKKGGTGASPICIYLRVCTNIKKQMLKI